MLLSYTIVDFYLLYDGAFDVQIWYPLTRSQCKKYLTLRWLLKPVGLLLF